MFRYILPLLIYTSASTVVLAAAGDMYGALWAFGSMSAALVFGPHLLPKDEK